MCAVAPLASQQPADSLSEAFTGAMPEAFAGVQRVDGVTRAVGATYQATFDSTEVTLTPALGERAPRNMPLRFSLLEFGRGSMQQAVPVEPEIAHRAVLYEREGVTERYDALLQGVEQSFVFATLPPGDGDLIVRGRISTEMPVTDRGPNHLSFEWRDVGGALIENVVGIDAVGRRTPGSMALEGDVLELRLPAAFVASATLPIVLDPFINLIGRTSGADDESPDGAYSSHNKLIVFHRRNSAADSDIIGLHFLPSTGGSTYQMIHDSAGKNSYRPRVDALLGFTHFIVTWYEWQGSHPDVFLRVLDSDTGIPIGPTEPVANGPNYQSNPEIGGPAGSSSVTQNNCTIIWLDSTLNRIYRKDVFPTSIGGYVINPPEVVAQGSGRMGFPAISSLNQPEGKRKLVVWAESFSTAAERDLKGIVLDGGSVFTITSDNYDDSDPAVDGDGENWIVAFERRLDASSNDSDIYGCRLYHDGSRVKVGPVVAIEANLNDDEISPAVAWTDDAALVSYDDKYFNQYQAVVSSLDPYGCQPCEGSFVVAASRFALNHRTAMFSHGPRTDVATIMWEQTNGTGASKVYWREFHAEAGTSTLLGGGCGGNGIARSMCALIGNSNHAIRLTAGPSLKRAYLSVSASRADVPCGLCTLVPDLGTGVVIGPVTTSPIGEIRVTVPLPNDPTLSGGVFYAQWFVGGSAECFGYGLSDAVRVKIQ